MVGERRQHTRLVPSSPMFVSLDASKSGLLLDVCQGGVAVASLIPRNLEDVIALEFELPEGCGRVTAKAEVTWTRDCGHLNGARFLDLDEYSRQQLSHWLRATANTAVVEVGEQPSLFADRRIDNGLKNSPDVHPVDAYFLVPPNVEDRKAEIALVNEEIAEPNGEELPATSAGVSQTHDEEMPPAAMRENFDPLVREAEASEAAEELPEMICQQSTAAITEEHEHAISEVCDEAPAKPEPEAESETAPEAEQEAPILVKRSTYPQVEPATHQQAVTEPDDARASEAQVQLARAAAFEHAANAEAMPLDQAADLAVQPWHMPRPAGVKILTEPGLAGTSEKSRHTIELILAVVLLSWALVFLGYEMGTTGVSGGTSKDIETTNRTDATTAPANVLLPSVEASAAPALASAPNAKRDSESSSTLGDSGLVLQVGAMKLEDNADALAKELQKKNLPAFVFRHGSDHLYRVAVGPYSDEQATARVRARLEKQGLKPILRRWLPD